MTMRFKNAFAASLLLAAMSYFRQVFLLHDIASEDSLGFNGAEHSFAQAMARRQRQSSSNGAACPGGDLRNETIAYTVSVESLESWRGEYLYDYASVLHQSIRLASRTSCYRRYKMIAFVHPEAESCRRGMEKLGYEVRVLESPFGTDLQNSDRRAAPSKEYLRIYSYSLVEYPVVVHLDLDTLVMKKLDSLFDLMLRRSSIGGPRSKSGVPAAAMWNMEPADYPRRIDFMYTRDYNSADPNSPHWWTQAGVQGSFLVIRPSRTEFDRMVEIARGSGWGGSESRLEGYYGEEGTIKGLAAYYYGEIATNRSLELNRCHYNSMADDPMNTREKERNPESPLMCRTREKECQNCRSTSLEDIYTAHLSPVCGRPHLCPMHKGGTLCARYIRHWHFVRSHLEDEWQFRFPEYTPNAEHPNTTVLRRRRMYSQAQGHCKIKGKIAEKYIGLTFPAVFTDDSAKPLIV